VLVAKALPVTVVREKTVQSKVFAVSVAVLISLAYVNMGCALDLEVIGGALKRPVGPAIGFACQFVLMPLTAYALGFIFPSAEAPMRLGTLGAP
jgi:sodium/bile acid cotransporter 3/5